MRITVWNEFLHELQNPVVREIYPQGIHDVIAKGLQDRFPQSLIRTAVLHQPDHGLTAEILEETDVLYWWGHLAHDQVSDSIVDRVYQRVLQGMGLVVLHSGHASKIFRRLMGTSCMLRWRDTGEKERIWFVQPSHPLVDGLGEYIEIPRAEMYGEHFDIPVPSEVVAISWFEGGEVFRSLCTFHRGRGKIVYIRPGHETFPIYHQPEIMRLLGNAALWAMPSGSSYSDQGRHIPNPLEKLGE